MQPWTKMQVPLIGRLPLGRRKSAVRLEPSRYLQGEV